MKQTSYRHIDISSDWRIVHMDLDEGLRKNRLAYKPSFRPEDPVSASVPVTAPAAYLEADRIPDPYFGRNNLDATWMEQKEWWFFKDFDLPRLDGTYRLTFEGVNYRAEAWLNGVQIDVWEGTFLTRSIDLDPELLLRKGNRLTVRVRAQERAWEDGAEVSGRGFQNSTAHIRTQRPTPQYAHGWNWSPHIIALGIWRPVRLEWFGSGRFEDGRVHAVLSKDHKVGRIRFTGNIHNLTGRKRSYTVHLRVSGPGKTNIETRMTVTVKPQSGKNVRTELKVLEPQLWWPNGYGKQPLYKVEVSLISRKRICDRHVRKQGFRRIQFLPNENDTIVQRESGQTNRMWSVVGRPYPWTLEVNGKRIFSKGSNWCPVDNLYRPRRDHLRRLLGLARDAHYVMLRIWGGGLTESDEFYDICDELGFVCFQEFWLACGSYPAMDSKVFIESARTEIVRLRERTSLAFWGGGNEFNPDSLENKPLIDRIERLVADVDGSREFRRGSPYRGDRHGGLVLTPYRTTNKYSDLLPGRKRMVLLRSECAVGRSPARPSNIKKFMPEESLWPIDWTEYQNHHAQKDEWAQVTRPFGKAETWEEELLHASVMHCFDSRYNMEYARSMKYESSGCLTWQLNASWPSFHREHVDWYGDPKPVYYWYKNACKPLVAMADLDRFVVHPGETFAPQLSVVNDTHQSVKTKLDVAIVSHEGSVLHEATRKVAVDVDGVARVEPVNWRIPMELAGKVFYFSLTLRKGLRVVHRNTYWLAVSPDTKFHTGRPLGRGMTLTHLGGTKKVDAPHYYTQTDIVDDPNEPAAMDKHDGGLALDAEYTVRFSVPEDLRGKKLEMYMPGMSADDEVFVNGRLIGSTTIDSRREKSYLADPLRWPTLPVRFYDVPTKLLKDDENELKIVLSGKRLSKTTDRRFGLSEMIYLRERTSSRERQRIRAYMNKMEFYVPITRGPKAGLTVSVEKRRTNSITIKIANKGKVPAAFLVLDIENNGSSRFVFDEGAIAALIPGEVITVHTKTDKPLPKCARLRLSGLNIRTITKTLA